MRQHGADPPELTSLPVRIALLVSGILVNAIATGMYIGAGFGAGPRDGLMTTYAPAGLVDPQRAYRDRGDCVDRRLPLGGVWCWNRAVCVNIGGIQLCLPGFARDRAFRKAPQPEQLFNFGSAHRL